MSGNENLSPEMARIIADLRDRIDALERRTSPIGAEALSDLREVYIDVLTRADGDVLTWVEDNQDWEALSGGGFPITYDDGTYTYSIFIDGPGELTITQYPNASPTDDVTINFDTVDLNIDTNDFNLQADNDANISPTRDNNLGAGRNVNISATGDIIMALPTSDPAVSGALWNDSGTVKVSP